MSSCRDDDSNEQLHPPSWLQGTWESESGAKYHFTENDFISIQNGKEFSYAAIIDKTFLDVRANNDTEFSFTIRSRTLNKSNSELINNLTNTNPLNYSCTI